MTKLCVIRGFPKRTDHKGSFVNAHEDLLTGDKVVLDGYHPWFEFNGRQIVYFWSTNPLLEKLKKLLPHVLYHRLVERHRTSPARVENALKGFFKTHNVDVVLAEFGNVGSSVCPYTTALKIPLIVHFHGHDAHRTKFLQPYHDMYQRMFREAFRIVVVSEYMKAALLQMGAPEEKLVLNPYGPNEAFFDNEPTYDEVLVGIGRFTDIKAPQLTILAFQKALEKCPHARLVIGGHGELLEACQTLVNALGISDNVSLPGKLNHNEVCSYFTKARCFVQHSVIPTYGDAEGTPVAILEAQAAGLPVVATHHAGIPQAVVHGETGYLVDECDVDGMADYFVEMLQNRDQAENMGQAARRHIRKNYSMQRHLDCLNELIAAARAQ